MLKVGTAVLDVEPKFDGVQKAVAGQADGIKSHLSGAFKAVALGAGAIFAGIKIGGFLQDAIGEFQESAKVGRLTEAVIKSTGGAAHVTAGQVGELAKALAAKTGIDDEVIQSGENVLATFTNIRNETGKGNDIFNQATATAVDLSAALGQDMQSSVIQLGKALNDPIKGVTALQRVGVSFTSQQKDQIKTLVESGKTLEAQKVILAEVQKEFGGAAAAAADPVKQLQVVFGNLKESIGGALFPLINQIAPVLQTLLPQIADELSGVLGAILPTIQPVIAALGPLLLRVVAGITPLIASLGPVFQTVATIAGSLGPVFQNIGVALAPVVAAFGRLLAAIAPVVPLIANLVEGLIAGLAPVLPPIIDAVSIVAKALVGGLSQAIDAVLPTLVELGKVLGGTLRDAVTQLAPVLAQLIRIIAADAASGIQAFAQLAPALIQVAGAGARLLASIPPPVLAKLVEAFLLFKGVKAAIGPVGQFAGVIRTVGGPVTRLVSLMSGPLVGAIRAVGVAIVSNPIGLIITGVIALGAAVVLAYQHFKPFRDVIDAIGRFLRTVFVAAFNLARQAIGAVVNFVINNWPLAFAVMTGGMSLVAKFVIDHWETIKNVVTTAINAVWNVIQVVVGAIVSFWQAEWNAITLVVSFVWGIITGAVSGGLGLIRGIFDAFVGAFRGAWEGFWGGLKATVDAIAGPIVGAFNAIIDGIRAAWNAFRSVWNSIELKVPSVDLGFGSIGGETIGLPDLPRLWTGGIVKGSPAGTPIIAGDRNRAEAVVPLPNGFDFSKRTSDDRPIEIHNHFDRDVSDRQIRAVEAANRRALQAALRAGVG